MSRIQVVNIRTIFGHTPTSDSFWTKVCPTFRTSERTRTNFPLKLSPLDWARPTRRRGLRPPRQHTLITMGGGEGRSGAAADCRQGASPGDAAWRQRRCPLSKVASSSGIIRTPSSGVYIEPLPYADQQNHSSATVLAEAAIIGCETQSINSGAVRGAQGHCPPPHRMSGGGMGPAFLRFFRQNFTKKQRFNIFPKLSGRKTRRKLKLGRP